MVSRTLRDVSGLPASPPALSQSALILIDCQETYRTGIMQLEGVEPALQEASGLLARARVAGRPIIHIVHDAGPGSPYDLNAASGQICSAVAPLVGEMAITKNYPSSFHNTILDDVLKELGVKNLVLAGFMTHMCVNSTARQAFNLGYNPVIVSSATATRSLPLPGGGALSAQAVHDGALAGVADLFATVVSRSSDIAD
jgi:nicotinamidase-related amidase